LAGEKAPIAIDYWFRPLGENEHSPIPSEYVDGKTVIPIFYDCDSSAFYCINMETRELYEIDPGDPWPPVVVFSDWSSFENYYLNRLVEDKDKEEVDKISEAFNHERHN
jgi:hypothetical protein